MYGKFGFGSGENLTDVCMTEKAVFAAVAATKNKKQKIIAGKFGDLLSCLYV